MKPPTDCYACSIASTSNGSSYCAVHGTGKGLFFHRLAAVNKKPVCEPVKTHENVLVSAGDVVRR